MGQRASVLEHELVPERPDHGQRRRERRRCGRSGDHPRGLAATDRLDRRHRRPPRRVGVPVSTPIDPNVIATYDPNAAPGPVAHASQLRQDLAEAISTFSEASAAAAPKESASAAALRELGTKIATAP